jgi:hypothetical protein
MTQGKQTTWSFGFSSTFSESVYNLAQCVLKLEILISKKFPGEVDVT